MHLNIRFDTFFKIGLLLLGITVPSSMAVSLVNSLGAGFLSSIVLKKQEKKFLVLLFSAIFLLWLNNSWEISRFILVCFFIIAGLIFGSFLKKNLKYIAFLFVLTLGYLLIAFFDGKHVRTQVKLEPVYDRYTTDMRGYLKTYFLVGQGKPFYSSYALSEKGDISTDSYPGEIWGWKTPFLFYLWNIFPGSDGRSIYWLFVILVVFIPVASFLIAKEVVGKKLAALSSFLVWPYFLLPLKELSFIQVEWWGLIFFFFGFYFLLKKINFYTFLFFIFAVFSRELYLVHLAALLAVLILKKDKKRLIAIFPVFLIIIAFYVFVHIPQVAKFENLGSISNWLRSGGVNKWVSIQEWFYVRNTLAYNSWQYLLFNIFPSRLTFAFSFIGLGGLFLKRKKLKYLLSLGIFVPFFIFMFKPGLMTMMHDYWGIYYVPLTFLFAPSLLMLLRKKDR
ncbi:hypothetical protein ACFLZ1_04410 [Patescibacteria group bacterium]